MQAYNEAHCQYWLGHRRRDVGVRCVLLVYRVLTISTYRVQLYSCGIDINNTSAAIQRCPAGEIVTGCYDQRLRQRQRRSTRAHHLLGGDSDALHVQHAVSQRLSSLASTAARPRVQHFGYVNPSHVYPAEILRKRTPWNSRRTKKQGSKISSTLDESSS